MSKFEHGPFFGGFDDYAVNAEKYTRDEAIGIYLLEKGIIEKGVMPDYNGVKVSVCDAFVRHRAGVDEENIPCVCWWLEYGKHKRSCPAYAFHITTKYEPRGFEEYDIIDIKEWSETHETEIRKAYRQNT